MDDFKPEYKHFYTKEDYFQLRHGANTVSGDRREFSLHHHIFHEIYIFLGGKADFLIESASFRLNPYDLIIIPPYTLHQPQPYVNTFFERVAINIYPDFFNLTDCTEYQDIFFNLPYMKHKIPGHIVKNSNILGFIDFFLTKFDENDPLMKPLIVSKLIELLYNINTIDKFEKYDTVNQVTQDIISYVDENFRSISSIDDVAANFFYSKNHLSYLFKKYTGITIAKYINIKKMENVEKLHNQGKSLTYACIESGFNSYDNFAYIYKKEFGKSPKNHKK